MNVFHAILPTKPPPHIQAQGELAVNRERILQTLLVVFFCAAVLGWIGMAIYTIPRQQYGMLLVYTGLAALLFAFTAYRKMAYTSRVLLFTLSILGAAVYAFAVGGLQGNGEILLLVFIALITVLLGWKAGVFALLSTHLAFPVFGLMITQKILALPPGLENLARFPTEEWIRVGLSMVIASSTITFAIAMLIRGLESSYFHAEKLTQDLRTEQISQQARVEQRTIEIKQRMGQILTASEVSQIIVSLRDPDQLLPKIVDLLRDRFDLYYAGVFIVDDANNAVLRAGSGDAGKKMIAADHYLPVDEASMIGWAITNAHTRVALDVGSESVRFNNPYLPDTKSELAVPIIRQNTSVGAISIQSDKVNAFDEDEISIFEGIANALAIALENTQLLTQAQNALDEVRSINRGYLFHAWSELASESGDLSYSYENYQAKTPASENLVKVPISLRDQAIGHITLEIDEKDLSSDQQAFIDVIAAQTALALENARLINETQRRATHEQILNDLTANFSIATNIEDILKSALRQLDEIPAVSEASIQLISPGEDPIRRKNGNGHESQNSAEKIK